ncbi:MAG: ABC transporter substrate-binding protein [Trebonia sp.]
MRTFTRGYAVIASLATLALAVTACGGSSTPTSSGTSSSGQTAGFQALNPGTGAPQKGGTLNMLGIGDVDYMDYNISYYEIGALGQRIWVRGLYAYPATPGRTTDPVPDLATTAPAISSDGLTYSVTIRSGAMWNTSPARQVTAADALLGLKRACNPAQPWGGLPDFETLIVGYQTFCTNFSKVKPTAAAIKAYIDSNQISGVTVSGQTITYKLTHPATYFASQLSLDPFNPAPAESLNYIPASAAAQQHAYADGPYMVQSYTPTRSIVFVRNPAWNASSDPVRKAYVDKIVVTETGQQETNQQQLQTNTAAASMEFDSFPPVSAQPDLVNQMKAGSKNFNLGPTFSSNPYIVYNEVSPNNGGGLSKVAVRQALSYGISRSHLIQDNAGPVISPPLTHVLPPGVSGAQDVPPNYDPYPYNPAKAKQMLAAAGYPNGLTLKMLYRPSSSASAKMFQTLQADLAAIGVKVTGVGVPTADFYTKYLEVPTVAHRGVWDISLAGWGPDWYPNGALSFFRPLFSGPPSYPPVGSNFGFYDNPAVNTMISQAASTGSESAADALWAQLDQKVMQDAPIYPITDPQLTLYHASYVHNAVYVPALEQFDPTNVWLSTP